MKIKVGVDVRLLSRSITGIGRYSLEMCKALSQQPGVSLQLYSPAKITADLSELPNATIKEKNWNNPLLRQLWGETFLPYWVKKDKVDIFWGPAHRLPRSLPRTVARVVTIHDLVWKVIPESMKASTRFLEKSNMPYAIRSADHIITDSVATAESVKNEYSIVDERVSVVPLAGKGRHGNIAVKSNEKPYILFVGTLEPRKNLIRLLQAYSQLSGSEKDKTNLYIVGGEGWGNQDVDREIKSLGLEQHVKKLGYVSEEQLAGLYQNCLFLAMPSLYEGFGLPLVEAMGYGKAVLTSNNSSMPEVAGDAGILVNAFDVDSIRIGLEKLINNDSLRKILEDNAFNQAAKFSWNQSAEKLTAVFKNVISYREERVS